MTTLETLVFLGLASLLVIEPARRARSWWQRTRPVDSIEAWADRTDALREAVGE